MKELLNPVEQGSTCRKARGRGFQAFSFTGVSDLTLGWTAKI
jgi:hypothetical protein